tara:strand:+ start:7696 stop:8424 length:729 start_codon:yes stop_codon:yes gene_type:complete
MGVVERGPGWELRLGRWQDVLSGVECDAVITDPPYSSRTARGQRSNEKNVGLEWSGGKRSTINYGHITDVDAEELVEMAAAAKWLCVFGDHICARWHEEKALAAGRYAFAPIPWCKPDAAPRMANDGPPTSAEWLMVSRLRNKAAMAAITKQPKGYYVVGTHRDRADQVVTGGKPVLLMRQIVRSYSLPGDLIVDPYAGGATTLLAAVIEGRKAIGAERDPETFAKAVKRLRRGWTPELFPE